MLPSRPTPGKQIGLQLWFVAMTSKTEHPIEFFNRHKESSDTRKGLAPVASQVALHLVFLSWDTSFLPLTGTFILSDSSGFMSLAH